MAGKGVLQGTGQAVGERDVGADQTLAMGDEVRQGAPRRAVGAEWGERVTVCEAALDLGCGSGRGIWRPARGTRFAILGHGEGRDGTEHEELIVGYYMTLESATMQPIIPAVWR